MTSVPRAKANEAHASEAETENWPSRLRKWIVKKGISIMCPNSSLSTNVAADIPLFRGGMRLAYLKALAALGISNFVARSGLGYSFVCHVGDLAAFPFYHPGAYRAELELASAWLRMTEQPLAFDVGANEGFFACHLAQMIGRRGKIYAFEPVPETFAKLAYSVWRLGLAARVKPIPAAVLDSSGPVQLSWSDRNSLEAQVIPRLSRRADHRLTWADAIPLDTFLGISRPSRSRISLLEPHEVQYWADKFNVSKERLSEAVRNVGHSALFLTGLVAGINNFSRTASRRRISCRRSASVRGCLGCHHMPN